ncbi:hypothetical protein SAMN05421890_4893 [Ensifer adhaerens]|nr:hypothetical protein SAMN05421890_4893 [Ensifer adhaerens]
MNNKKIAAFLVGSVLACASGSHAASLCPAGTKTVDLVKKGSDPKAPVVVLPTEGGDYSEGKDPYWDLSAGKNVQFQANCSPHLKGFRDIVPVDIPKGVAGCKFSRGALNCR